MQALRNDAAALYRLADRVAGRIKTPPTMDREDVVQDAVVALIELIDAGWTVPSGYPTELGLILAATNKLGARKAYYHEWQWSRRRIVSDDTPETPAAEPGPSEFATVEQLLATLLDCLPAALRETASTVFSGTPIRDLIHAATTRGERARLRREYAAIRDALAAQGLWTDPHGSRRK